MDVACIPATVEAPPAYSRGTESSSCEHLREQEKQNYTDDTNPAAQRTLHIYADDWRHKHVHILDDDKTTRLYEIESHMMTLSHGNPQLTIKSASTSAIIGTARWHTFKTHVDMTVLDQDFPLISRGALKCRYSYSSPSLNGLRLTWKAKGLNINFTCKDDEGILLAGLSFPCLAKKKIARLELFDPRAHKEGILDEIVVTGATIVKTREIWLSYGAAAAVT